MRPATRRRMRLAGGFVAYFVLLWTLWPTAFVYPLKIFVVLLHEISHGVAAVITGGSISHITLDPAQGGATWTRGGSSLAILSAGYLGSLAWGLLMLEMARARPRAASATVLLLGVFVLAIALAFVRNVFGFVFATAFGVVLLLAARTMRPAGHAALLTVLGLTSALYALLDIRSDVIDRPHLPSDAHMLAEATGIPTAAWGIFWIAIGLIACAFGARRAWRNA